MWTVSILLVCTVVSCFSCQILDSPFYTGCFLDFKKLKKWLVTQWTVYVTYDLDKCDQYHFQFLTKHCVHLKCLKKMQKTKCLFIIAHSPLEEVNTTFFMSQGLHALGDRFYPRDVLFFYLIAKRQCITLVTGLLSILLFRCTYPKLAQNM